jgi:hypothetical protein
MPVSTYPVMRPRPTSGISSGCRPRARSRRTKTLQVHPSPAPPCPAGTAGPADNPRVKLTREKATMWPVLVPPSPDGGKNTGSSERKLQQCVPPFYQDQS